MGFQLRRYTGGYFQTNAYLIEHAGGSVLVDAPEGVAGWLAGLGVKPDALLLTHLHYDHVLGAADVRAASGCRIVAHSPPDGDLLLTDFLKSVVGWPAEIAPFQVDHLLAAGFAHPPDEALPLKIGGLDWSVLAVPGHSPDSVAYGLAAPEGGADWLFGGDALFRESIGRTDFPHGDHAQLISSIRTRLYTLPDATRVFPGHGGKTTVGHEKRHNPFVSA